MKRVFWFLLIGMAMVSSSVGYAQGALKIALAGLSHDHVHEAFQRAKKGDVVIVGIAEHNKALVERYQKQYKLASSLFYKDLKTLLKSQKPDAVLAYNAIAEHLAVVEACAPLGVHVMVEKPLATTVKDAERMASLARQHKIHLLTNYETTWYPSNQKVKDMAGREGAIGEIRKMVVHDGHQGPKEIGCSKEFLEWLTDPVKNGGGALIDFGCYGANLMTWLMKGEEPISVMAVTKQVKPDLYPKVDDDATIVLEYSKATGIVEASWNWPFNIKDLEVFGQTGYLQAVNNRSLRKKLKDDSAYKIEEVEPLAQPDQDYISYLAAVIKGEINPANDLSSLENNLIVVKILEAAKQSARDGRKVYLKDQVLKAP